MFKTKVTAIGNSLGVVLPKEALTKMHVKKGDVLYVCETPAGYSITPYDEEFVQQMTAAEEIMQEDKDVLKVLSKS
jgi:putative addiction module antidote